MPKAIELSERQIQITVVEYLKIKYRDIIIGMSPIHKCSIQQGVLNKRMGYTKGYPDIFLPYPRHGLNGLFIELKTATGVLSKEQKTVISELTQNNYKVEVCHSIESAKDAIDSYFSKNA